MATADVIIAETEKTTLLLVRMHRIVGSVFPNATRMTEEKLLDANSDNLVWQWSVCLSLGEAGCCDWVEGYFRKCLRAELTKTIFSYSIKFEFDRINRSVTVQFCNTTAKIIKINVYAYAIEMEADAKIVPE